MTDKNDEGFEDEGPSISGRSKKAEIKKVELVGGLYKTKLVVSLIRDILLLVSGVVIIIVCIVLAIKATGV